MQDLFKAAAASLTLVLAGCVDLDYSRVVQLREPPIEFEQLVVGETRLEEALEGMGAPLLVYEIGPGAALVWGWYRGTTWGVQVSVPIGDQQGSVSYSNADAKINGLSLYFDEDWVLTSARTGSLRDLTRSLERDRPQFVEDLEEETP